MGWFYLISSWKLLKYEKIAPKPHLHLYFFRLNISLFCPCGKKSSHSPWFQLQSFDICLELLYPNLKRIILWVSPGQYGGTQATASLVLSELCESAFNQCDKIPERSYITEKRFILPHGSRVFSPWLLDSGASGLAVKQNIIALWWETGDRTWWTGGKYGESGWEARLETIWTFKDVLFCDLHPPNWSYLPTAPPAGDQAFRTEALWDISRFKL